MKHIMIEGSFEYVIFFRNFQKKLWTSDVMNFMIMSEFKCLYIYIFETLFLTQIWVYAHSALPDMYWGFPHTIIDLCQLT